MQLHNHPIFSINACKANCYSSVSTVSLPKSGCSYLTFSDDLYLLYHCSHFELVMIIVRVMYVLRVCVCVRVCACVCVCVCARVCFLHVYVYT